MKQRGAPGDPSSWKAYLPILGAAARDDWDFVSATLKTPDFDRNGFIDFLAFHDAGQYFYWCMSSGKATASLPAWLAMHLIGLGARERERSTLMSRALQDILVAAEAQGIELILLKGVHLAVRFYGSPGARRLRDLDLLARPQDFETAQNLLGKLGYRHRDRVFGSSAAQTKFTHAVEMYREDIVVDLHQSLRNRPAYRIDMEKIWSRRKLCAIGGNYKGSIPVLSDCDTLSLLLLSIVQDVEIGNLRAKTLLDLYLVIDRLGQDIDWQRFLEARAAENLLEVSLNALGLLLMLFECNDRFPTLSTAVEKQRHLIRIRDRTHAFNLARNLKHTPKNRLWYLSVYPGNRWRYLVWLTAGLAVKPHLLQHMQSVFLIIPRFIAGIRLSNPKEATKRSKNDTY